MHNPKYTLESVVQISATAMTCEQCDEMFRECISEVDPDAPAGYEVCQILWDRCKSNCSGNSSMSRKEARVEIKRAYAKLI